MDIEYWELIAKKLGGEFSSEEEEEKFAFWLKSDKTNELILKEAERIWKLSASLKNDFQPNTERVWLKLQEQLTKSEKTKSFTLPEWFRVAAAFASAIIIGFILNYIIKDTESITNPVVEVTTTDSIKVFNLSDNTRISLNKNSRFTYPENFNDSIRITTLEGEAFFEVTPNRDKPFIIHTAQTQTRVFGTSFNVKAYEEEDDVEVTVVSGKVQVQILDSEETEPVYIEAGNELIYNKTNTSIKKQKSKNTNFMWWKKHSLEKEVKQLFKKVKKII